MKKLLKHGIFALLGALLVTAFFTSCPPPVGEFNGGGNVGGGNVQFVVNKSVNSRTIKPTGVTTSSFLSFRLDFAVDSTVTDNTAKVPATNPVLVDATTIPAKTALENLEEISLELLPGTYTMTTTAYMAAGQTNPAATATQTIVIPEGNSLTIATITLTVNAAAPASGSGTFGWNIDTTGVTGLSGATLAINPITAGGTSTWAKTAGTPVNLMTGGNANTFATPYPLLAGYYDVIFDLTNTSGGTASFLQVLQVYANLGSQFAFSFTDAHFVAGATVTFNSWNFAATPPANVVYDTKSCAPGSSLGSNMPTPPTKTDYTFLGWYTTDGHAAGKGGLNPLDWGTQFTAATTVSANTSVYARWLEDGELNGVTDITLNPIGGTSIVLYNSTDTATVAEGATLNVVVGGMLALIVQNASAFTTAAPPTVNIDWIRNGVNVVTGGSSLNVAPSGDINTTTAGTYLIVVRAREATGEYQSSYFTVRVQP